MTAQIRRPTAFSRRTALKAGAAAAASLAAVPLAACGIGGSGTGAQHRFRLAETHPENYPTTLGDKRFADLVRERSGGRIDIQVYAGGRLGEESDIIEQVQLGVIEMTRVSSAPMAEFAGPMGLFGLPFIFDDADHMWRFLDAEDGGRKLLGELDRAGFKGLCYFDPGARSFYTTDRVITTPEDVRGLKFRVQQAAVIMDFISALGGSPTPMNYGEVYSSLQSGLLDGAENNAPSYFTASHYEVAPNFTLDEHMRVAEILIVNRSVWEDLPTEDQNLLQQAAFDAVPYQRKKWNEQVDADMQKLREAGVTITRVDDIAPWRAATKSVIDKYGEQYAEYLDRIAALRRSDRP
ncbi:TRAP transporter substrate-binding protein [Mycolicibacterium smegmatis]|uniref:Trap-t family protein transporter, dctp n=1 Tax=Mycolicibacterium smegmatis (strain MKD8) TaxID=1214915 RepID=A0A2U9Q100_MYCSE|nr:TRAP transporter substrate-binding protein [Mycolicibacterium smegmatis]AWT57658.1 trap-t family protein transporter, dctp [Mycolicibacterium smegmatis MKD8]